ncbi:hypothetical protein Tco_0893059 [Tanacetum coccineum]|uniref:Uncharacterized protein n=1 Tax=Tanacetum coccineum TaxID=301880 RepID=A0ABQ5C9D7_9ASTR
MKPKTVAQARRNMIKYLKNQGNYKINDFKGMSYNDIRPIFEKVWDFNQNIEPMDAEHGSENQKSPTKEKSPEKTKVGRKIPEKEELKGLLDIIPREEVPIEVESISIKFSTVDWKTYVLTETFMYYQFFRGDGSSKNYKILSEMLEDVIEGIGIHILLMENGLAIHMLTEKKYPLSQEMLSRKLEVDHESSQAFELLRFIRSQVQK